MKKISYKRQIIVFENNYFENIEILYPKTPVVNLIGTNVLIRNNTFKDCVISTALNLVVFNSTVDSLRFYNIQGLGKVKFF